eukprot:6188968-Amphidinium_carterae.1
MRAEPECADGLLNINLRSASNLERLDAWFEKYQVQQQDLKASEFEQETQVLIPALVPILVWAACSPRRCFRQRSRLQLAACVTPTLLVLAMAEQGPAKPIRPNWKNKVPAAQSTPAPQGSQESVGCASA